MEFLGEPGRPAQTGPYRPVAAIGQGGMGRVLLAVSPDGRLVAVKLVHEQLVHEPGFRDRFRREVTASRRVSGAYTAAVLDADADAPTPWLASVFVPGPALREVVERAGPLPPPAAVRLAAGLAAALGEVHRAGLIHRDLKPSNVLLAADGPRVIDFGIARATDSEGGTEITRTGMVVGSPAFMSPEQAEGRALTPAADVFSLGSVVAYACTGRSPFTGTSALLTLYDVVHGEPELSGLPEELRGLVRDCLAKDPAARPAPAEILARVGHVPPATRPWPAAVHELIGAQEAEIERALGGTEPGPAGEAGGVPAPDVAGLPTQTAAPAVPPRVPPEPPVPPAASASASVPGSVPPAEGPPAEVPADAAEDVPADGAANAPADGAAGRGPSRRALVLGALGVAGIGAAVGVPLALNGGSGGGDGKASGAPPTRTASRPPSPSPSTAPPSTAASPTPTAPPSPLPAGEETAAYVLSEKTSMLTAAEISRDGRLVAVGDMDGGVVLRRVPSLQIDTVLAQPVDGSVFNSTGDVAFSPDGKLLASVNENAAVTLWDVASRKSVATLHGDPGQRRAASTYALVFSRDGKSLALGATRTITVWDVASRRRTAKVAWPQDSEAEYEAESDLQGMAFTADGRTVVASTSVGKLHFCDLRGQRIAATVRGPREGLSDLAVSPNGKILAVGAYGEVRLWRPDTRKALETVPCDPYWVSSVAFSRDGKYLAVAQIGGSAQVLATADWSLVHAFDSTTDGATDTLSAAMTDSTAPDSVSFSPRADYLAEPLDYCLALWKLD
ncbi:protein kinase domain-containing protein [Streptomyces sp. NRRL F-5123]|uniref:protein kinase domain-containing protein n=1 Tax=Streptomyces sp. NRRL F-5123 TaxID=1463856 RepID=UPI0004E211BE|nr:protein kinase [Streptomyces sp. NRRL F-5123]